jgi:hypothetical protein
MVKPRWNTARFLFWGLVCLPSLLGCSVLTEPRFTDPGFQGRNPSEVKILAEVEPQRMSLKLAQLRVPSAISPSAKAGPFRGLSETDCVVAAANASTSGRLLDAKAQECSQGVPPSSPHCRNPAAPADLRTEMLRVAALEARNRSAAGGLELFYRLELAHAQREVLQDSCATVAGALEDRDRLLTQGMTIPVPLDELRQQLFDLQFRLVELDEAIARLSNELKDLLSLGPQGEPWLVWPLAEVRVDTHPIDVEAAVQIGLARRPEVGLLRRLDSMQSSDTMRALQLSLSMVNPLLGMSCGSSALSHRTMPLFLHSRGNESEDLASLRCLWDIYRQAREQEIAKEISSAALEVQASLEQIIVANGRLRCWEDRIGQIKAREAGGAMAMSPLEQTQAELRRLEALAALWKSIADWQIAVAHLRREQFCLMP